VKARRNMHLDHTQALVDYNVFTSQGRDLFCLLGRELPRARN
jgi:hypothetical protein